MNIYKLPYKPSLEMNIYSTLPVKLYPPAVSAISNNNRSYIRFAILLIGRMRTVIP